MAFKRRGKRAAAGRCAVGIGRRAADTQARAGAAEGAAGAARAAAEGTGLVIIAAHTAGGPRNRRRGPLLRLPRPLIWPPLVLLPILTVAPPPPAPPRLFKAEAMSSTFA